MLLLWSEALDKGYTAPIWFAYKQAASVGAQVRKGEHGATVVYADKITKSETNDNGEQPERSIPFMKAYTVFNCEQIDGLPLDPGNVAPRTGLERGTCGGRPIADLAGLMLWCHTIKKRVAQVERDQCR